MRLVDALNLSHANDYANPVAASELPFQEPVIGNSGSAFCSACLDLWRLFGTTRGTRTAIAGSTTAFGNRNLTCLAASAVKLVPVSNNDLSRGRSSTASGIIPIWVDPKFKCRNSLSSANSCGTLKQSLFTNSKSRRVRKCLMSGGIARISVPLIVSFRRCGSFESHTGNSVSGVLRMVNDVRLVSERSSRGKSANLHQPYVNVRRRLNTNSLVACPWSSNPFR